MNRKALILTIVSFIPFVGAVWWSYKVSKHIVNEEDKNEHDY